jgi:hypothetical protein
MISFLLQFPQLKSKIERLLEKPLKEKIDLSNIENYPNDLEERHKILADYDKIKNQLETKDETIWKILNEKKQKEKNILDNAKKRSMEQIEEKAKLSDKYDKDLKKYMIVCAFCGKYIDKKTVNSECIANEQFYLNFYFTKEAPPMNLINTKRHYFGEPVSSNLTELFKVAESMWDKQRNEIAMKIKEEEEKMIQEQYMYNSVNNNSQINSNNMSNNNNVEYNINIKKSENTVKQTTINNNQREIIKEEFDEVNQGKNHEFVSGDNLMEMNENRQKVGNNGKEIVENLLKIIEEKKIDLFSLLSNCDTDEDGFLEKNELKFGLNSINEMNQNDFEALLRIFNLNEKINIKEFVNQLNQEFVDNLNHSSFSKKSIK